MLNVSVVGATIGGIGVELKYFVIGLFDFKRFPVVFSLLFSTDNFRFRFRDVGVCSSEGTTTLLLFGVVVAVVDASIFEVNFGDADRSGGGSGDGKVRKGDAGFGDEEALDVANDDVTLLRFRCDGDVMVPLTMSILSTLGSELRLVAKISGTRIFSPFSFFFFFFFLGELR